MKNSLWLRLQKKNKKTHTHQITHTHTQTFIRISPGTKNVMGGYQTFRKKYCLILLSLCLLMTLTGKTSYLTLTHTKNTDLLENYQKELDPQKCVIAQPDPTCHHIIQTQMSTRLGGQTIRPFSTQ